MRKSKKADEFHRPVVWVVGASRGIGREIAKQFALIGSEVCLSSRSAHALRSAVKEITDLGGRAYSFPCNVSSYKEIFSISKKIQKKFDNVDVLINAAGITVFKSFLTTTLTEFDAIINTNLRGPIFCIKSVLPNMVERKSGWIINVVSNAAIKTFEGSAAYTATKAGLLGLSKVVREEMRHHNIKVVSVIPGATKTEMWSRGMQRKYGHRMMSSKSVAEAVLSAYQMPNDVVVDEIVVRPMMGDVE
jgi:short-subunit dehydrogenase